MMQSHGAKAASSRAEVLLAQDLRKSYGPREALQGLLFPSAKRAPT
jgi:hypothetical protein